MTDAEATSAPKAEAKSDAPAESTSAEKVRSRRQQERGWQPRDARVTITACFEAQQHAART